MVLVVEMGKSFMIRLTRTKEAYFIEDFQRSGEWACYQSFAWDGTGNRDEMRQFAEFEFHKLDEQILSKLKQRVEKFPSENIRKIIRPNAG